jgi:hypothetical protein
MRCSDTRPSPMRSFRVVSMSSVQPCALSGAVGDLVSRWSMTRSDIFDETTVGTVRDCLVRNMSDPKITSVRMRLSDFPSQLSLNQIYWACCKLQEEGWLRDRPLFEADHIRVCWEASRHQAYD